MKTTKRLFLDGGLVTVITMLFIAGCSSKNDAISNAEKMDKDRPSIAETKAIAEEGFIYGLPLVMNYAIMNAYSINRESPAFTARGTPRP